MTELRMYANRKLYDPQRSKTVSLGDVAKIVRAGDDVTVVDFFTKADITVDTLVRVLLQCESGAPTADPADIRRIIRGERWAAP